MDDLKAGLSPQGVKWRSKIHDKVLKKALEVDKQLKLARAAPPSYMLQRAQHSKRSFQARLDELEIEREKALEAARIAVNKDFDDRRRRYENRLEENEEREIAELVKTNKSLEAAKIDFGNAKDEYEQYFGKCPIQLNIPLFTHAPQPAPRPPPLPPQPVKEIVIENELPILTIESKPLETFTAHGITVHVTPEEKRDFEHAIQSIKEEEQRMKEYFEKEEEYKLQQREIRERERRAREEADRIRQDAQRKKELEEREEEEDDKSSVSSTPSWIKEEMKRDKETEWFKSKPSFTPSLSSNSSSFTTKTGTNTNAILGGPPSVPALPPPKPKKPVKTIPKREPAKNIGEIATYKLPEDD